MLIDKSILLQQQNQYLATAVLTFDTERDTFRLNTVTMQMATKIT